MKIRRAVEELEIANDINLMSKEEIEAKYFASEESYNHFLQTFANYFMGHMMYPLRVSEQFDKITELLKDGNAVYFNDTNLMYIDNVLSELTDVRRRYKVEPGSFGDERHETQALFLDFTGEMRTKSGKHNYEDTVSMIYEAGKKYLDRGDYYIGDFDAYSRAKMYTSRNRLEFMQSIDRYLSDHPLTRECNDIGFLYFANYMLNTHKKLVDEEFVQDVKEVISASLVLQDMGYPMSDRFNKKEYNKVSKFTLKTIKRFEDAKAKGQKEQEKGIAKKKIK